MKTAYLSLGSNMGDRAANLQTALDHLASPDLRVTRVSPIYETDPVGGPSGQRWYLNLAAEIETGLFPMQLLARTQKIEMAMGRRRTTVRNAPRIIDIDILLFARAIVHTLRLEIPHPRMQERRFVLQPLADLAPDLRHPVTHRTVREMLDAAPPAKISAAL